MGLSRSQEVTPALRALIHPSPRWLFETLFDWLMAVGIIAGALSLNQWWGYLLAVWALGPVQHRIALMAHDGAHGCAAKTRWLNDLLTCVFAFWPMGIGLSGYRRFHLLHHRTVGTPADPELIHKNAVSDWNVPTTPKRLALLTLRDLFGLSAYHMFWFLKLTRPASVLDALGPIVTSGLAWYLIISNQAYDVAMIWFGALLSSFWCSFRWRIFFEHVGTDTEAPTHRFQGNRFLKLLFLPHHADYHWEHHRWPTIPCWNLPKARVLASGPEVQTASQVMNGLFVPKDKKAVLKKAA